MTHRSQSEEPGGADEVSAAHDAARDSRQADHEEAEKLRRRAHEPDEASPTSE